MRFRAYFWAAARARPIGATLLPFGRRNVDRAVNAPVMKRLPESS
jgi:hypothetical protein